MASVHPIVLLSDERPRTLVRPADPKTGREIDVHRDTIDPGLDTLARQYQIFYWRRSGRTPVTFGSFVEVAEFLAKAELPETKAWRKKVR
jgi:hypothetical protein